MKISFAICTYNRLSYLKLVTEDFFKQCNELGSYLNSWTINQEIDAESGMLNKLLEIEFLLINNNSNDATEECYKSFIEKFELHFASLPSNNLNTRVKYSAIYIFEKKTRSVSRS